jgi:hypothetical protein
MTDLTTLANPFRAWTELARVLRNAFVEELKVDYQPMTPHCGEFLGSLSALITQFEHLDKRLHGLERHDHAAFEAFLRALENS